MFDSASIFWASWSLAPLLLWASFMFVLLFGCLFGCKWTYMFISCSSGIFLNLWLSSRLNLAFNLDESWVTTLELSVHSKGGDNLYLFSIKSQIKDNIQSETRLLEATSRLPAEIQGFIIFGNFLQIMLWNQSNISSFHHTIVGAMSLQGVLQRGLTVLRSSRFASTALRNACQQGKQSGMVGGRGCLIIIIISALLSYI